MPILEHDGQVHNPLGGASYVFEEDIVKWLSKQLTKNKVRISIGAQPNSSPHFGTLTVFSLAFALAEKIKSETNKDAEVLFEVIDTAPAESKTIDDVRYQLSLRDTGVADQYLGQYHELLEKLKSLTNVAYIVRKQSDFNKQPTISNILKEVSAKKDALARILDPDNEKLRMRVACQKCGLTDKHSINTVIEPQGIKSFCPEHGWFETSFENSDVFEYNTPLRNLIRAIAYSIDNQNNELEYEWLRVTGSDYAGFYQEQMLYKPASLLGYKAKDLPMIIYAPLITDWSGAKLSKSLYVKQGAYKYLPSYVVNFEHFRNKFGELGIENLFNEVKLWVEQPYRLFRGYSVYYFMDLFNDGK
ncbi:MAG: hypothetical protein R3B92_03095 [Patescibacteria group bacterium]